MRKTTKLLSAVLAVCMLVSAFTFSAVSAAEFSDVSTGAAYYDAVQLLSALQIINGYEDGTFGPEKNVTRAEFATMLMRAMASANMGSSDPAGMTFTDLGDASWAISDIRTAYDLGIINGMSAEIFAPNDSVTYEQALKMIVCALGYDQASAEYLANMPDTAPWYTGYMYYANELNLTSGISVLYEQPAKRWEIARMIYNALEVQMVDKYESNGVMVYQVSTKTFLYDKLGIVKSRGEVRADEANTMDPSGAIARTGYTLIYDNTTKVNETVEKNGTDVSKLLGKTVDYYYKITTLGDKQLVFVMDRSGSDSVITVDVDNLDSISGTYASGYKFNYYENEASSRTSTVNVEANPTVSVNGKVVSASEVTADLLYPESGTLEFIATGGVYNKINITAYETYVVKSVNTVDRYIVDMYRASGSNTLTIDAEDSDYILTMNNTSGSAVSLSGLSQYNVLSVKKSNSSTSRNTIDITVSNRNISGNITSMTLSDNVISVSGTEYKISAYLTKYGQSDLSSLTLGDTCKFYLDKDGKICAFTKTTNSSTYYGYIAAAGKDSDVVKFAILSSKSTNVGSPLVSGASKIKVDGTTYSKADDILEALAAAAKVDTANIDMVDDADGTRAQKLANRYSQVVQYTVNTSGAITAIDTALPLDGTAAEGDLEPYIVNRRADNTMTYKSSSNSFVGATSSDSFRINSSTQVFLVPSDRSSYSDYARKTYSYFKDASNYVVEAYNVTGSLKTAEVVVVYESEDADAVVDYDTPLLIITGISSRENSEGNPADCVTGYQITKTGSVSEVTVYTENAGVIQGSYAIGDAIMYATTAKGFIKEDTIRELVLVSAPTDGYFDHVGTTKYNASTYQTEIYHGYLMGADVDGSDQMFDLAIAGSVAEIDSAEIASLSAPSSTKFFVYDGSATTKVTNQESSFDLTSLVNYNDTSATDTPAATELFVYKYANDVKAIYVIKR